MLYMPAPRACSLVSLGNASRFEASRPTLNHDSCTSILKPNKYLTAQLVASGKLLIFKNCPVSKKKSNLPKDVFAKIDALRI